LDAGVIESNDASDAGPAVDVCLDQEGEAPDASGPACGIDSAGATFTFHVHNDGSTTDLISYGCGLDRPITLTTPEGALSIGPGQANSCEFTCQSVYQGDVQPGCTECQAVYATLDAGATLDILWDRRVYTEHLADPSCVGGMTDVYCALPIAVAPTNAQAGQLTVCSGDAGPWWAGAAGGHCSPITTVTFTLDTTGGDGTIEVP
jgi:hypothetical protein